MPSHNYGWIFFATTKKEAKCPCDWWIIVLSWNLVREPHQIHTEEEVTIERRVAFEGFKFTALFKQSYSKVNTKDWFKNFS